MHENTVIEVAMHQDDTGEWLAHSTLADGMCRYSNETKESYIKQGFTVKTLDEACDIIDNQNKAKYIDNDYAELTEDQYMDGIEQLSPYAWFTCKSINFYECLEAMSGDIRGVWVRYQGKFYHNYVSDRDTPDQKAQHFLNWVSCKGC